MSRRFFSIALMLATSAAMSSQAVAQAPSGRYVDKRIAINLSANEKNQILAEMREFLHGFHGIHLAMARQDMKTVALTARPMGALLDRIPVGMKERLPEEFTQLAIAMNEAFQAVAHDAENNGDISKTHENLAEVMTYCSGCHDTYRFNIISPRARK
jgi:cytochrome c556